MKALLELRAKIIAQMDAINVEAGANPLTEDQAKRWDALKKQWDENEAAIKRAEFMEGVRAVAAAENRSAGRGAPAGAGEPPAGGSGVSGVHPRWEDDARRGFRDAGEFLLGVLEVGRGRAAILPEHQREALRSLRIDIRTAGSDEAQTLSDSAGGFLTIPPQILTDLLMTSAEPDQLAGRVTAIRMASPRVVVNARVDKDHRTSVSGGFAVYRRAETQTVEASKGQFEEIALNADQLMGLTYVSDEILSLSPISFVDLITKAFGDEFNARIMAERIGGTGAGQFLGIKNSPCLITVEAEDGQEDGTIVYENLVNMRTRIWGYGNSVWVVNQDALGQLMLLERVIGVGGSLIWQPSAVAESPDMLLGRPIVYTDECESPGTLGDIYLANFTQYLEGTFRPVQSAESIHVRFVEGERAFRFTCSNAGAPWWRSTLTPKNGSTRSPFVTLAARA